MRTTSIKVKGILGGDYDCSNNPSLIPFIESASVITDRVVTCAADKGHSLTTVEAELIERWLAAHAYAMSDQVYKELRTGNSRAVYSGMTKMYLEATKYGQMASSIDTSGCLTAIAQGGGRKVASLTWLGKAQRDKITYEDRN